VDFVQQAGLRPLRFAFLFLVSITGISQRLNVIQYSSQAAGVETDERTEQDLVREGWTRCFLAEEPRLSEAIETYRELGFEVALARASKEPGACLCCVGAGARVIYTRKRRPES
jgi:hypothetical protein